MTEAGLSAQFSELVQDVLSAAPMDTQQAYAALTDFIVENHQDVLLGLSVVDKIRSHPPRVATAAPR